MKKVEVAAGFVCLSILLAMVLYYQRFCIIHPVENPVVTESEEDWTSEGFEEAEDAISYLLAQIEAGSVENALRVCSIKDIADYFSMALYLEYTEEFQGTDMIPACEEEGDGYAAIAQIRLASDYGNIIQACIERMSREHVMKVYGIEENVPENPDGKYFQRLQNICDILGSRDVAEYIVYLEVDGTPMELHLSMARYRRFWKVLKFSDLQMNVEEPAIFECTECPEEEPMNFAEYRDVILPMNYILAKPSPLEDSQQLLENFCMYLHRGDVLSAMACFDFGISGEDNSEFSMERLEKQKTVAVQLQTFYYKMMLQEADFAWAGRHFSDTPEYLPELVRLPNMQFVDFYGIQLREEGEAGNLYVIPYGYNRGYFESTAVVSEEKGLIVQFQP